MSNPSKPITFLHCHVTIYNTGDGGDYEPAMIEPPAPTPEHPAEPAAPDAAEDYKRGYNDAMLDMINQAKRGIN